MSELNTARDTAFEQGVATERSRECAHGNPMGFCDFCSTLAPEPKTCSDCRKLIAALREIYECGSIRKAEQIAEAALKLVDNPTHKIAAQVGKHNDDPMWKEITDNVRQNRRKEKTNVS